MKKYVACNNLIDPTYKRRIMCDERLEKLFKKKIVSRKNVYHLLEVHFRENHVVVDDDAQDNAPPLFSLRLMLRFFQSVMVFCLRKVKGEVITRAWVAQILPDWAGAIHVPS
nr:Plus-3 domain, subgroup protein [Ipomoea batatas]GMD42925.1 Plus-3 domain, subgroup protein [Ipomoea batatas]GME18729.1 Plus-3 domain, subgroup protein [Ipomoea batatas]